jgi:hypothetical protein
VVVVSGGLVVEVERRDCWGFVSGDAGTRRAVVDYSRKFTFSGKSFGRTRCKARVHLVCCLLCALRVIIGYLGGTNRF